MIALLVSLTVVAGAPRGLAVKDSLDLVTRVDARLAKWMTHGGAWKALLATKAEVIAFEEAIPIRLSVADRRRIIDEVLRVQSVKPELRTFVALKALVASLGAQASVSFFDSDGRRCYLSFSTAGHAGRWVLLTGPYTDDRTLEKEVESAKSLDATVTLFEKKDGAWAAADVPAPPPTPPPGCLDVLKKAAKSVVMAEKSYFAERDEYSKDLSALGVDVKSLGVSSVKIELKGSGPTGTFTAEVAGKDGVVRINEQVETTVVKACTAP